MISPTLKLGFLGSGNMANSFVKGILEKKIIPAANIFLSNRSERKINKMVEHYDVGKVFSNEELFNTSNIIFVCVKPQDLREALEPLASVIHEDHLIVSLAAGVTFKELRKILPHGNLIRVMPNTALSVQHAVIGISYENKKRSALEIPLNQILKELGQLIEVEEGEMLSSLTVGCSSGIGFVFELMTYWQDWLIEYGYTEEQTRRMTVETFLGASLLAKDQSNKSFEEMQDQVASRKGMTSTGLESMRENDIERGLRIAFEKTMMREKQLAKILE